MRNPFDDPFSVPQRDARLIGVVAALTLYYCIAATLKALA